MSVCRGSSACLCVCVCLHVSECACVCLCVPAFVHGCLCVCVYGVCRVKQIGNGNQSAGNGHIDVEYDELGFVSPFLIV